MKNIPLTQGLVALVDDGDYEWLSQWRWCASNLSGKFYSSRELPAENGKRKYISMHRQIMNTPPGMYTDHINGDSLDNRRENLRVCTNSQNMMNRGKQQDNTSGYKGVCFHKQNKKWYAQIRISGKKKHIGFFPTAIEAARAYDRSAKELFGEFARLNFPNE